jgi:hypothetical protein
MRRKGERDEKKDDSAMKNRGIAKARAKDTNW